MASAVAGRLVVTQVSRLSKMRLCDSVARWLPKISTALSVFCRHLKTELFSRAYGVN